MDLTPALLASEPLAQTDPTFVLLMWCAGAVGVLANVVGFLVYAKLKQLEKTQESMNANLTGHPEGVYSRQSRLEEAGKRAAEELLRLRSDMAEFKGEIRGEFRGEFTKLEQGTLRADLFKERMASQDSRLADLKEQVSDVEHKVDRALTRTTYESPFPRRPGSGGSKPGT